MPDRRYRVVYPDRTTDHVVSFHLAQQEWEDNPDALHFDRFIAGGWIPLGWRGGRPASEPPALNAPEVTPDV